MGGDTPKQFRLLGTQPVLLWSLQTFLGIEEIAEIAVVLPAADAAAPPSWLTGHDDRVRIVAGGAERHDSVENGTRALGARCITVLVHDAARPLVDAVTINAVIAMARTGVGAVPVLAVGDTIKESGGIDQVVARTVPRERLWRAQTPQGFPRELLQRAQQQARADRLMPTDDAAQVEHAGGVVRLVQGAPNNFKLTTVADFELAGLLVSRTR